MMVYVDFHKHLYGNLFLLDGGLVAYPPETKEKHHLVALKIRLEAHIFVLSAAVVAAEVAAAAAAVALPASDIP